MTADLLAGGTAQVRKIPAPVRLPAVSPKVLPTHWPATPAILRPIAADELQPFEPAAAMELDLGLPHVRRTTVGGWIDVGYRGGVGQ